MKQWVVFQQGGGGPPEQSQRQTMPLNETKASVAKSRVAEPETMDQVGGNSKGQASKSRLPGQKPDANDESQALGKSGQLEPSGARRAGPREMSMGKPDGAMQAKVTSNQKETEDLREVGETEKFNEKCRIYLKAKYADPIALESFIRGKLSTPAFHRFCAENNILIQSDMKKWEGGTFNPLLTSNDEAKLKFFMLDKYEATTAIAGEAPGKTRRPIMINSDTMKKVAFRYDMDYYVDVEQELKLIVFTWKDYPDTAREELIMAEIMKFKDKCLTALAKATHELGVLEGVPLVYNPYMMHNTPSQAKLGTEMLNFIP